MSPVPRRHGLHGSKVPALPLRLPSKAPVASLPPWPLPRFSNLARVPFQLWRRCRSRWADCWTSHRRLDSSLAMTANLCPSSMRGCQASSRLGGALSCPAAFARALTCAAGLQGQDGTPCHRCVCAETHTPTSLFRTTAEGHGRASWETAIRTTHMRCFTRAGVICDCGSSVSRCAVLQICLWCWHHIMEMAKKDSLEGRCPACRSPYDKEKIVSGPSNERDE